MGDHGGARVRLSGNLTVDVFGHPGNLLLGWRLALRVVIPILVRRDLCAREALGLAPFVPASGTNATSPEGMPNRATTGRTYPTILGTRRFPAHRAVDFWFVAHGA